MKPQRARNLADLLVLLAMVLPWVAAWVYFVALAQHPAARVVYLSAKGLQLALPLLWLAWMKTDEISLGRIGARWRSALLGLVAGLAAAGGLLLLYRGVLAGTPVTLAATERIRQTLVIFGIDRPGLYLAFSAGLAVGHSLFEEYYWRWFVFGRLTRHLPVAAAGLLASLAFSAHHFLVLDRFLPREYLFSLTLPGTLAVAAGGWLWCELYRRTGSLTGSWVAHILVDAALLAIGYRLVWP